MRVASAIVISLWGTIYTGSLAWAVWKAGNRRGGWLTALLALAVLLTPTLVEVLVPRE